MIPGSKMSTVAVVMRNIWETRWKEGTLTSVLTVTPGEILEVAQPDTMLGSGSSCKHDIQAALARWVIILGAWENMLVSPCWIFINSLSPKRLKTTARDKKRRSTACQKLWFPGDLRVARDGWIGRGQRASRLRRRGLDWSGKGGLRTTGGKQRAETTGQER